MLIVLLLKNLLRKFEDFLGPIGECSESAACFSETGLALSRSPGEFYLVLLRLEGLYEGAPGFTLRSGGCFQTHSLYRERPSRYS